MIYISPDIEIIKLDNEISLALESDPPIGDEFDIVANQQHVNPFQTNMVDKFCKYSHKKERVSI